MPVLLRDAVNKSASYLASAGISAPRLEAELLISAALQLERIQLYVQFDRPLSQAELAAVRSLLLARAKDKVPAAYLIGRKSFLGLELSVPRGVFIPRPETEELVDAVADRLPKKLSDTGWMLDLLDLCTGTGAIGLALAHRIPRARIFAVDIAKEAVQAATENALRLGLNDRFTVVEGDLWQGVPCHLRFDAIIANPPYIPRSALNGLTPEITRHEALSALDGGEDGLDLYRRIMPGLSAHLRPNGLVGLEHGHDQAERLARLAEESGLAEIAQLKDLMGRPRILLARLGGYEAAQAPEA